MFHKAFVFFAAVFSVSTMLYGCCNSNDSKEISRLRSENYNLDIERSQIKQENRKLEQKISELQTNIGLLKAEIDTLKNDRDTLITDREWARKKFRILYPSEQNVETKGDGGRFKDLIEEPKIQKKNGYIIKDGYIYLHEEELNE